MNMGQLAGFRRWGYDTRGWAHTTQYRYSTTVCNVDRWLVQHRDTGVWDACADDLKAWMTTRPANAGTRNGYRDALHAYYCWMQDVAQRADNPADVLPRLRVPRHLPKALHDDDARLVLDAAPPYGLRWVAVVTLMFYGGLRASEVIGAQWADLAGGMLHVRGKGSYDRVVPLAAPALEALSDWRGECPSPVWLFPSPRYPDRHQSYGWTHRTVCQIAREAGVAGFHPHVGRHTAATHMIDRGADVRDVAAFLGHVSLQNTAKYLAVRPARVAAAVTRMAY